MRKVILATLLALSSTAAFSQKPQYYWSVGGSLFSFLSSGGNVRRQFIYHAKDFPTAPTGNMSAIYLQVNAATQLGAPSILYNLTIKMGYIADSNFHDYPSPDTFKTGLSVVYSKDTTVLLHTDSVGKWIKIPLNPYSFTYFSVGDTAKRDSTIPRKYFVVEFSSKTAVSQNPMRAALTCPRSGGRLDGYTTQPTSTTPGGQLYDFGFDIGPPVPNEVAPVASSQLLAMYPNPANDWLHISGIKGIVSYSITDMMGKTLRSEPMPPFYAVPVHDLPPGIYVLRIWGDKQTPQTLQFVKQ